MRIERTKAEMSVQTEQPSLLPSLSATRLMSIVRSAEDGDCRDLFALYRDVISSDPHLISEFAKRKNGILGDTISTGLTNDDKVRTAVDLVLKHRDFRCCVAHLLNAALWPVAIAQKVWRPSAAGYALLSLKPVEYCDVNLDRDGRVMVCVLRDNKAEWIEAAPERYIVHRSHLLPVPDRWGGPMRALLVWWLLKNKSREWWADALERFGLPFLIGTYSDEDGMKALTAAFNQRMRMLGLIKSEGTKLETVTVPTQDLSNSHTQFIALCDAQMSKLVVGQPLSSTPNANGLGSGQANLAGDVKDEYRENDAKALSDTLRWQLLCDALRYAGLPSDDPPAVLFGSATTATIRATMGILKSLGDAGLEPDDDALPQISETVGFTVRRKNQSGGAFSDFAAFSASDGAGTDYESALADETITDDTMAQRLIKESATPAEAMEKFEKWLAIRHKGKAAKIEAAMRKAAKAYKPKVA